MNGNPNFKEALVAGDDWYWAWQTEDDVSHWSDLHVSCRDANGDVISDDDIEVVTDFETGFISWRIPASVTIAFPSVFLLWVSVLINDERTTLLAGGLNKVVSAE